MSHPIRHFHRFFRGALSILASGLLVGGLASCSSSNNGSNSNGGSQLTLTLSPASIRLTAGAAGAQASLLLAAPAGAGAATAAVSGLPSGVTVSPATLSLTPGVALPLTLTAASSATTTTATVTFTTTVNGQTATTQASLSIQAAAGPAADFSLSVMPASVTLTANGAAGTVSVLATCAKRVLRQRSHHDYRLAHGSDGTTFVPHPYSQERLPRSRWLLLQEQRPGRRRPR